jgi:DNA polymerase-3 subunit delta
VSAPVVVIKGADAGLVGDAAGALVDELVGDGDRDELVEELFGDEYQLGEAIMAAESMAMFGDRVVVARHAGRFTAKDLAPLVDYLAEPNPTSTLVVVWERPVTAGATHHSLPKKVADAVKAAGGEVRDVDPPVAASARAKWLDARLAGAAVRLDGGARTRLAERLGEDVSRVAGVLEVLEGAYGAGATVTAEQLDPFLGGAGSVPPWDLTDAIDRGDVAGAVDNLHRMLGAGDRHPLQLMATLQTHVERLLRLDGSGVGDETEAARLLGMKGSSYPAKKALATARRLGSERIAAAVRLLAAADADLRGATAQPPEMVMEVLVARLARLSGRR